MSIQYTVPGLELTTFREHESPSTTARQGLEFWVSETMLMGQHLGRQQIIKRSNLNLGLFIRTNKGN